MHANKIGVRHSILLALLASATARAQSTGEWTQATPLTSPPPLAGGAMVYDPVRDRVVLVAGADVWEFDGVNWQQFPQPASAPGHTWWDDQAGRVLRVQSAQTQPAPASLLGWNGATWDLLGAAPGAPQPLQDGSWVFDSARRRGVWFLGNGNQSITYECDGISYMQVATTGPASRTGQAMVFDRWRSETLLFGGADSAGARNDTWTWNGYAWSQQGSVASPAARTGAAITFDSRRNRVLLFGGALGTQAAFSDTWEWDGWAWIQAYALTSPPALGSASLVFDSLRNRYVLFGGIDGSGNATNQTWLYASVSNQPSTFTPYGQGCAGPAGTPTLAAVPGTVPGIGQLFQMSLANLPPANSLVFGVAGFDDQSWNGQPLPLALTMLGMPGCSAWVRPDASVAFGSSAGSASWSMLIPCLPALVGLQVFVQAAVVAPGANAAGLLVSNAGHIVVGTP